MMTRKEAVEIIRAIAISTVGYTYARMGTVIRNNEVNRQKFADAVNDVTGRIEKLSKVLAVIDKARELSADLKKANAHIRELEYQLSKAKER